MKVTRSFKKISTAFTLCVAVSISSLYARENIGGSNKAVSNNSANRVAAGCSPTTDQMDLNLNNVRARVLVGGDMWWDLANAQYEVPKGSKLTSIFAGALWIGGLDAGGQIKVAAQTYRQTGYDFWGGPIDTVSKSIAPSRCNDFDKHWRVTKDVVGKYRADKDFVPTSDEKEARDNILSWPGNGPSATESHFLAPFEDLNTNGLYEPELGEYPRYNFTGNYEDVSPTIAKKVCNDYVFGDQTIWWVFNDVGNAHTETESQPIGLEVRAQAFAFKTNDEINDMTFYKYQIINQSTFSLNNTYIGQWVDPDLGNSVDDYVGCDVGRGLGYCYNGDEDDEGVSGYGENPPAIGVDFFQGPLADINDNVDNDRDGCEDCTYIRNNTTGAIDTIPDTDLKEQIIMSKFVYYNNDFTPTGNPVGFTDFYNYLNGVWRDGQQITYGGTGHIAANPPCNFMFPGTTDPAFQNFPADNWTEKTVNNTPADRRFLQSAGTFTLEPGAVNYVTTGVVWRRATQGGVDASVSAMKLADDKAQALFDNCFKLIDGPNAPDVAIRELDKEIILSLQNTDTSSVELYHEKDPTIVGFPNPTDPRTYFDFQGYQIYQLKNATVTVADLKNPDKARLLYQCDKVDTVKQIVNFIFNPITNANDPIEQVNGANLGVRHTFRVTKDLFATGNTELINHKTYFYTVISYAFNNFKTYDPRIEATFDGQQKPYLAGRNNIKTYTAIPHIPEVENGGQILNADYGSSMRVQRIEGQGNGGSVLDMDPASENEVLNAPYYRAFKPTYVAGHGPIDTKVYDPTLVKDLNFEVKFNGTSNDSRWSITELSKSLTVDMDNGASIGQAYEQVLSANSRNGNNTDYDWGISLNANNVIEAGITGSTNNGLLESSIEFADNSKTWLSGVKDIEGDVPENWIWSGISKLTPIDIAGDADEVYEGVVDGTWTAFRYASFNLATGPRPPLIGALAGLTDASIALSPNAVTKTGLASVDVVFTSDKSKWTRSAVIEMGETNTNNIGGVKKFNLRASASVGKAPGEVDNSVGATGMSWFPGYAYNVETGERLNIAFGENSTLTSDNGTDMIWNPTVRKYDDNGNAVFGGMHYIYIFGHNGDTLNDVPAYDSCRFIYNKLVTNPQTVGPRKDVWKDCMWTTIPILASGQTLSSTDVRVRLRVTKSYRPYATTPVLTSVQPLTIGTTYYVASVPLKHNNVTYNTVGASFVAATTTFTGNGTVTAEAPLNGFNPMYRFGTGEFAPSINNTEVARTALDLINVVPNPYYAYSAYEGTAATVGQLDNRIKIVNLPAKCTISIFTINGSLVRRFERAAAINNTEGGDTQKGNSEASVDWDLKNSKGIVVASGMYLIHIEAPDLGERTIKWFGVLRPLDLSNF